MLIKHSYTPEIDNQLSAIGAKDSYEYVREQIMSGHAAVFKFNESVSVLAIENAELVVLAYYGTDANGFTSECVTLAKQNGLTSIRFHTSRKGLHRLISKFNPVEIERVYRIKTHAN